jgi:hypothetical protein
MYDVRCMMYVGPIFEVNSAIMKAYIVHLTSYTIKLAYAEDRSKEII